MLCCVEIVRFEFAKRGAKIIGHVKSPTFRTAKLKVFTVYKRLKALTSRRYLPCHMAMFDNTATSV